MLWWAEEVGETIGISDSVSFPVVSLLAVQANYRIMYSTKSSTSVPDPVYPIPQCIDRPKLFKFLFDKLKRNFKFC